MAHFSTKSYAEHKALGKFYDDLIGKIDTIVEAYQGYYGLIGEVRIMMMPKDRMADLVRTEIGWIQQNREKIAKKNTTNKIPIMPFSFFCIYICKNN